MDISNGTGIGISLFVQGCHFHCQGCFNQDTWDFNGGSEWSRDIEDKFVELANKEYIERISILGGEPLADENVETIYKLIKRLKKTYPNKKIWLYTGYTWEEILYPRKKLFSKSSTHLGTLRMCAVREVDVLCEGRFDITKQDLYNKYSPWVGSTNQRVLKPYDSIVNQSPVLYTE